MIIVMSADEDVPVMILCQADENVSVMIAVPSG